MELIKDSVRDQIIASARKIAQDKNPGKITVRDILHDLHITNRVFYNRFHNIDEVLEILYMETTTKVRESLSLPWKEDSDFAEHIRNVAARTLILTYDSRRNMSQFIFEADSLSNTNYEWWVQEITDLIRRGKEIGYIQKDLDEEAVSYSIWCFIRGFNADAMARKLSEEEALRLFHSGFDCFLNGMRASE